MGMPVSLYTMLRVLDGDYEDFLRQDILRVTAQYKAFAFIIHDANRHTTFHRALGELFDRLDYVTGPNLMFFAMVKPPQAWIERASQREYYQAFDRLQGMSMYYHPSQKSDHLQSELMAFSLSQELQIDFERPTIIITSQPGSKTFFHIQTDETKIEAQLCNLGYMVSRMEPGQELDEQFIRQCMGMEQKWQSGSPILNQTLAKALTDTLSFVILLNKEDRSQSFAYQNALITIAGLQKQLKEVRDGSIEGMEQFETLSIKLATLLALPEYELESSLEPAEPVVNKEFLEYETRQMLKTGMRVYRLLIQPHPAELKNLTNQIDDFSPGVVCFAKVFEREANLSLVHWIRRELGVKLPEYFDRYQPGVKALDDTSDFNKENRKHPGQWLPPGIGQSEVVFKRLLERGKLPPGLNNNNRPVLLRNWQAIRVHRNDAAHDRVADKGTMLEVRKSLKDLSDARLFELMYELKRKYKSNS